MMTHEGGEGSNAELQGNFSGGRFEYRSMCVGWTTSIPPSADLEQYQMMETELGSWNSMKMHETCWEHLDRNHHYLLVLMFPSPSSLWVWNIMMRLCKYGRVANETRDDFEHYDF